LLTWPRPFWELMWFFSYGPLFPPPPLPRAGFRYYFFPPLGRRCPLPLRPSPAQFCFFACWLKALYLRLSSPSFHGALAIPSPFPGYLNAIVFRFVELLPFIVRAPVPPLPPPRFFRVPQKKILGTFCPSRLSFLAVPKKDPRCSFLSPFCLCSFRSPHFLLLLLPSGVLHATVPGPSRGIGSLQNFSFL